MATQDWPSDADFKPSEFSVGPDVPLAQWRGINTGFREVVSRASDRIVAELTWPPCLKAVAARRESFINALLSTGDTVRFPMFHRRQPQGTMSGSPTVNGAVSPGARSITLASVYASPNIVRYGSFELDSNADGLADGWTAYAAGSTGSVSRTLSSGTTAKTHGTYAQRVNATALAAGTGNRAGVVRTETFAAASGRVMAPAVDVRGTAGITAVFEVDLFDAGASLVAAPQATAVMSGGGFVRLAITPFAVPSTAVRADIYVWMQNGSGAAALIDVDAVQLEFNSTASAFAGFATAIGGDFIGVGGNLLQVAYAGATADDAGGMVVPLVFPVQKAISNGAAVTLSEPAGLWQLDTTGLRFDYSVGSIQDGIVLPFRQVIA